MAVAMRQDVDVSAPYVPIDRDSMALGTLIDQRQVQGLPLDGRNFLELALLAPGTAPAPQGSAASVRGDFAFSVNGAREDANALPARRRLQRRPEARTRRAYGRRSMPSTSSSCDLDLRRVVRTERRRAGQRRDAGRLEPVLGHRRTSSSATARSTRATTSRRATSRHPTTTATSSARSIGGPIAANRMFFFGDYEGTRLARASRASPTCRRWPSARGTSRSRCSRRRAILLAGSRSRAGGFPRSISARRVGDRGAVPAAEPQHAVRQLRLVAGAARRRRPVRRADRSAFPGARAGRRGTASATGA